MIARFNRLPRLVRLALAVAISLVGGALALLAAVPLPWLLGALAVSAILSILGFELGLHRSVRQLGQVVAGFAVGLFFTPDVGGRVVEIGWMMVVGSALSIAASIVLALLLARFGRCDRQSAFFAMVPGGLAEMAGLAQQFGANVTLVALSQSMRIVVIVVTLPAALAMFLGQAAGDVVRPDAMGTLALFGGVALAVAVSWALGRMGMFNAWLLGGLVVGVGIGLSVGEPVTAPPYARAFAQVCIGVALGARFRWDVLRVLGPRFLPVTIIATLLLILVNVLIAWAFSRFVAFPVGVLGTAPGGIAEMSLTAEALHLAPPLVVAWQLVRIIMVAVMTGPLFALYRRFA